MTTTRPVHRMAPAARRAHAEQFVGMHAIVIIDTLRGTPVPDEDRSPWRYELNGRILSVASPLVGTVADVLVVRHREADGRLVDYAASMATVESITPTAGR